MYLSVKEGEKRTEIINAFRSFENSDRYVLITEDEIRAGNTTIRIEDITYNGEPCQIIATDAQGAYGYCYDPLSPLSVNVIYIEYETLLLTLLASVTVPDEIIIAEYHDRMIYFRTDDPESEEFKQLYVILDLNTKQTHIQSTHEVEIEENKEYSGREHFYINRDDGTIECQLYVTKKATEETKLIDHAFLSTCEEVKTIMALGKFRSGVGHSASYQKDGYIYLLYLYEVGFLGYPSYYYILKYDFDSHSVEYHTSIFFEEYPEHPLRLYIP